MFQKPDSGVRLLPPGGRKEGNPINPAAEPPLLEPPCTTVNPPSPHTFGSDSSLSGHAFTKIFCGSCGLDLTIPAYCGNRFCSVCGTARRDRIARRLQDLISAAPAVDGYSLKMITLTLPKAASPRAGVLELIRCFRRLRSLQRWRSRVSGGASVIEITGRPGAWHCHLHAIVMARYVPVRMLSRLWASVSPGFIVDIRQVHPDRAVRYLTKYLSKASVPEWLQVEVSRALKGTRLFQPFGDWYRLLPGSRKRPLCCASCGDANWLTMYEIDSLHRGSRETRPPPRAPRSVALLGRIAVRLYASARESQLLGAQFDVPFACEFSTDLKSNTFARR